MATPDESAGEPERLARRGIALALAVGLILRFAWLADATAFAWFELPGTDDYVYEEGARRILAGDVWLQGEWLRFGAPYFYVLAGVRALLGSAAVVPRLLNILFGCLTIVVVGDTARRTIGPRAGIGAALVAATYGPFLFFEALVLPEALDVLIHALLMWAAVRAAECPNDARRWAVTGFFVGAAIQLRANAALALVPLMIAALRLPAIRADRARATLAALVMVLATGLPMGIRNTAAMGTPFAPSTAGINLFIGNGPGARGVFRVPPEVPEANSPLAQFTGFREAAEREEGRSLSDEEADAHWVIRTRDHVLAHPLDALLLLGRKTRIFFSALEMSNLVSYDDARSHSRVLGAPLVQFGWLVPFALVGVVSWLTRPHHASERLLAVLFVAGSLSVISVFIQDRYRVPWVPLAILCAVGGGRAICDALRVRSRVRITVLGLVFLAGVGAACGGPARSRTPPRAMATDS